MPSLRSKFVTSFNSHNSETIKEIVQFLEINARDGYCGESWKMKEPAFISHACFEDTRRDSFGRIPVLTNDGL